MFISLLRKKNLIEKFQLFYSALARIVDGYKNNYIMLTFSVPHSKNILGQFICLTFV